MSLLKPKNRDYKERAISLGLCWFLTMPSIFALIAITLAKQNTDTQWVLATSSMLGAATAAWLGVRLYHKYVKWGEINKLKHILEDAQSQYNKHYEDTWARLDDMRNDPLVSQTVWYDEAAALLDFLARENARVQKLKRFYKDSKEKGGVYFENY